MVLSVDQIEMFNPLRIIINYLDYTAVQIIYITQEYLRNRITSVKKSTWNHITMQTYN